MVFPIQVRKARYRGYGNIKDKNIDEISNIKGMRSNCVMEILTMLRNHEVWYSKEYVSDLNQKARVQTMTRSILILGKR